LEHGEWIADGFVREKRGVAVNIPRDAREFVARARRFRRDTKRFIKRGCFLRGDAMEARAITLYLCRRFHHTGEVGLALVKSLQDYMEVCAGLGRVIVDALLEPEDVLVI